MISPIGNYNNEAVDWWFMYKLPMDTGPLKNSTGFEFLYCDSNSDKGLSLSAISLDHENSALALTLDQVFSEEEDIGYILWNDEIPPSSTVIKPKNNLSKGHSKGVLAFSIKNNCGFYLLHSTPRFPAEGTKELPENEKTFGQTYLCIALKDYAEVNKLATVLMTQNEIQVYASRLPGVEKDEPLYLLQKNSKFDIPIAPSVLNLETPKGLKFSHISKNKHWSRPVKPQKMGKDYWKDLVGPTLKCDLNVETWRRGLVFGDIDVDINFDTEDDVDIDLGQIGLTGYTWAYSKDHAKWGISSKNDMNLIIVSDLNRQISQGNRGGGGLAFSHKGLWDSLNAIEITEKNLEKDPHKDIS